MIIKQHIEVLAEMRDYIEEEIAGGLDGERHVARAAALRAAIDTLEKLGMTRDGYRVAPGEIVYAEDDAEGAMECRVKDGTHCDCGLPIEQHFVADESLVAQKKEGA